MKDKFGLPTKIIQALLNVFAQHTEIKKVILYGSRALGTFKSGSDIDLTLIAPEMSLTTLLKIETEIDDLLLPYKIDLSLRHQIENPDLLKHIDKHGVEFA